MNVLQLFHRQRIKDQLLGHCDSRHVCKFIARGRLSVMHLLRVRDTESFIDRVSMDERQLMTSSIQVLNGLIRGSGGQAVCGS